MGVEQRVTRVKVVKVKAKVTDLQQATVIIIRKEVEESPAPSLAVQSHSRHFYPVRS